MSAALFCLACSQGAPQTAPSFARSHTTMRLCKHRASSRPALARCCFDTHKCRFHLGSAVCAVWEVGGRERTAVLAPERRRRAAANTNWSLAEEREDGGRQVPGSALLHLHTCTLCSEAGCF